MRGSGRYQRQIGECLGGLVDKGWKRMIEYKKTEKKFAYWLWYTIPVSYTHLDVYKRQVLYNGSQKDRKERYTFSEDGKEYSFIIYWLKGFSFFKNGIMPSVFRLISQYDVILSLIHIYS